VGVGSTEGNLEKIFRLLKSLGRCLVFIDEADQALGKRDSGANDSGPVGPALYSMFAEEMSKLGQTAARSSGSSLQRPDRDRVDPSARPRPNVKWPILADRKRRRKG